MVGGTLELGSTLVVDYGATFVVNDAVVVTGTPATVVQRDGVLDVDRQGDALYLGNLTVNEGGAILGPSVNLSMTGDLVIAAVSRISADGRGAAGARAGDNRARGPGSGGSGALGGSGGGHGGAGLPGLGAAYALAQADSPRANLTASTPFAAGSWAGAPNATMAVSALVASRPVGLDALFAAAGAPHGDPRYPVTAGGGGGSADAVYGAGGAGGGVVMISARACVDIKHYVCGVPGSGVFGE